MIPLVALLITLAVEVPIVAACYPGQRGRMLAVALATNVVTNLGMNVLLPHAVSSYDAFLLVGEALALLVEAAVYAFASRPIDVGRALTASALANAASFGVGLLVFR